METPIDLQLLATFHAVADQLSFSKAAARLGVAKGTVSRSIATLEAALGAELLHRSTHAVTLSSAGLALQERTRSHLQALQAALTDLPERDELPAGLLRITAAPDVGAILLPPILAAFSRRHPGVRFEVRLSAATVDLIKEGYDLAIRVAGGPLKDSSLTLRRVCPSHARLCAAPSYLARRGRPRSLDDARHTWILHPAVTRLRDPNAAPCAIVSDDFSLIRALLREGLGVGILPGFVARADLAEGHLESIELEGPPIPTGELVLLYPSSGQTPRKVTAFRDFLIESLRASTAL